ncbi:MAG: phosphoribosylanthranilate isomerase [Betaproteobacteria bacterium]|nr:phosphoribosylanthranilate isomerase [Betaproteobacteria bacterium]
MRTRVKICGITRVEDGVAAAQAGADAIGLVFWAGSARAATHAQARAIVAALPPFVTVVGLFVNPGAGEVREALASVPLDLLQFHGSEPPAFCRAFGRPYLKAIAAAPGVDLLESLAPYEDAAGVLIDAPAVEGVPGGTGRTFDWALLPARLPRPLVLSGGLDAGNVGEAIRRARPWAVDVSSGVEARDASGAPQKGIKDAARIAAFVEEVRHAAR